MASNLSYQWNYDFPKLIRESGYIFNTHKHRVHINWNDIKAINIDKVVHERDFLTLDNHISEVLNCQLEQEFDTRILDSGFTKLFKLSQLSVEYLLECRKNLDSIVMALKTQLEEKSQEIINLQGKLNQSLKEAKRIRRTKRNSSQRSQKDVENAFKNMFVKNDNYLINNGQYNMQFHKCAGCDKVFMNQFYLESHMSRRHPSMQIDKADPDSSLDYLKNNNEVEKLSKQVEELKEALSKVQFSLTNTSKEPKQENCDPSPESEEKQIEQTKYENDQKESEMISKDTFEAWKEDEKVKMAIEINQLKENLTSNNKTELEHIRKEMVTANDKEKAELSILIHNQELQIKQINDTLKEKSSKEAEVINIRLKAQEESWREKLQQSEEQHKNIIDTLEKHISTLNENYKKSGENYQLKLKQLEGEIKNHLQSATKYSNPNLSATSSHKTENDETMDFRKKRSIAASQETLPSYRETESHRTKPPRLTEKKQDKIETKINSFYTDSEIESNENFNRHVKSRKAHTRKQSDQRKTKTENFKQKYVPIATPQVKVKAKKKKKLNEESLSQDPKESKKITKKLEKAIDEKMAQLGIFKETLGVSNSFFKKNLTILKRKQQLLKEKMSDFPELRKTLMDKIDHKIRSNTRGMQIPSGNNVKVMEKAKSKINLSSNFSENNKPNKNISLDKNKKYEEIVISEDSNLELDSTQDLKSESTEELLNSSIRKPMSSTFDFSTSNLVTSTPIQSVEDLQKVEENVKDETESGILSMYAGVSSSSSSDEEIKKDANFRKALSEGNLNVKDEFSTKKSLLKNAASTGSLSKKKVLFDLDANRTKSSTPSQSGTIEVKSRNKWNDNISMNTDSDDDWNFRINNESTKVTVHAAPKEIQQPSSSKINMLQLTRSIEAQLNARSQKPPVGGVNTIETPAENSTIPVPKPRTSTAQKEKDSSELDVSDWSLDDFIKST